MMPIWVAVALATMMLAFGAFIGYAIAAYEDLRQIEREQRERGWL